MAFNAPRIVGGGQIIHPSKDYVSPIQKIDESVRRFKDRQQKQEIIDQNKMKILFDEFDFYDKDGKRQKNPKTGELWTDEEMSALVGLSDRPNKFGYGEGQWAPGKLAGQGLLGLAGGVYGLGKGAYNVGKGVTQALIPGGKHGYAGFQQPAYDEQGNPIGEEGAYKHRFGYGEGQWAPGKYLYKNQKDYIAEEKQRVAQWLGNRKYKRNEEEKELSEENAANQIKSAQAIQGSTPLTQEQIDDIYANSVPYNEYQGPFELNEQGIYDPDAKAPSPPISGQLLTEEEKEYFNNINFGLPSGPTPIELEKITSDDVSRESYRDPFGHGNEFKKQTYEGDPIPEGVPISNAQKKQDERDDPNYYNTPGAMSIDPDDETFANNIIKGVKTTGEKADELSKKEPISRAAALVKLQTENQQGQDQRNIDRGFDNVSEELDYNTNIGESFEVPPEISEDVKIIADQINPENADPDAVKAFQEAYMGMSEGDPGWGNFGPKTTAAWREVMYEYNEGSYVPGNRTGDKNPAMLEDGEYVLNREAVKKIGKGYLDYINNERYPRFQSGGFMPKQYGEEGGEVVKPPQKEEKEGMDMEMIIKMASAAGGGGSQTGGYVPGYQNGGIFGPRTDQLLAGSSIEDDERRRIKENEIGKYVSEAQSAANAYAEDSRRIDDEVSMNQNSAMGYMDWILSGVTPNFIERGAVGIDRWLGKIDPWDILPDYPEQTHTYYDAYKDRGDVSKRESGVKKVQGLIDYMDPVKEQHPYIMNDPNFRNYYESTTGNLPLNPIVNMTNDKLLELQKKILFEQQQQNQGMPIDLLYQMYGENPWGTK